jgi:hypothetical protein
MMFANTAIEQKCNPYLKECWLVMMRGKYEPIIAAQKRVAKAQSMPNYDGYEWGWIDKDGKRHNAGPECTAKESDIIGTWGRVHFKDRKVPFYHEIFRSEYPHAKNDRKITMLMKTLRDQVHKFAYASEMGNLCTENEPPDNNLALEKPQCDVEPRDTRRKQVESTETSPPKKPAEVVTSQGDSAGVPEGESAAFEAGMADAKMEADATDVIEAEVTEDAIEDSPGFIEAGSPFDKLFGAYLAAGGTDFTEWAAEALCRSEEEVNSPEKFTEEMIKRLGLRLEQSGI